LRDILIAARENPQSVLDAPVNTPVSRVDETRAARQPDLRWHKKG
jgi:glycine dehydrogenase subunit 2